MKQKSKSAIAIIGGADGPTSVFVTGKLKEQSRKTRIQNGIYRYKRKKVEKTIVANAHTLAEVHYGVWCHILNKEENAKMAAYLDKIR